MTGLPKFFNFGHFVFGFGAKVIKTINPEAELEGLVWQNYPLYYI